MQNGIILKHPSIGNRTLNWDFSSLNNQMVINVFIQMISDEFNAQITMMKKWKSNSILTVQNSADYYHVSSNRGFNHSNGE